MRLILLLPLLLISCATAPPKADPAPKPSGQKIKLTGQPAWRTTADVLKTVGNKASLKGLVLDLQGNTLDGSALKHPSDSQDEKSVSLKIDIDGLVIRNGWVSDIPGGLTVNSKDVTVQKVKFINIGEDALSTVNPQASGLSVDRCEFHNSEKGDKSLQANCAVGLRVVETLFNGNNITAARVQESSYNQKALAVFDSCTFTGCRTAVNAAGSQTQVKLRKCKFSVLEKWVESKGAKVSED